MRITGKNRNEIKLLSHFMPAFLRALEYDDEAARLYFDWSDRGIGKNLVEQRIADEGRTKKFTYLSALYFGKRYRDLAVTSYLADWGETCFPADFVDEPKAVAEFLAKAMNKPGIMELWHRNESGEKTEPFAVEGKPWPAINVRSLRYK